MIGLLAGPVRDSQKLPVPYEKKILFDSGDFSFVGGPHELRTTLYGNPFGVEAVVLRAEVSAAMQTTNWHWRAVKPNMAFVDGLGSEEWRSLHVAIYLNVEPPDVATDYCVAAGNLEFRASTEPLSMRMVFYNGRELYSTTVSSLADVTSAGDAPFHKLLAQMAGAFGLCSISMCRRAAARSCSNTAKPILPIPSCSGSGSTPCASCSGRTAVCAVPGSSGTEDAMRLAGATKYLTALVVLASLAACSPGIYSLT